jgi:hypothetical protein
VVYIGRNLQHVLDSEVGFIKNCQTFKLLIAETLMQLISQMEARLDKSTYYGEKNVPTETSKHVALCRFM